MLKIQFGDMEEAIFNTDMYFNNVYEEAWLTDDFAVKVIRAIDKSKVLGPNAIHSPYLGVISPEKLAGGTKTLLLMKNCPDMVFNASTCGDNCAKWILHIADDRARQKRRLLVNLRHLMDFGAGSFRIRVRDPKGKSLGIATNQVEFLLLAGDYL